jgi:hypothetical protein
MLCNQIAPSIHMLLVGVSIKTEELEPELENRDTGVPVPVPVPVPVWTNQKSGTPVLVPGFWYPVFTGLNIYIFFS